MKAVAETPTVLAARGRDRPRRESSSSRLKTTGEEGVLRSAGENAQLVLAPRGKMKNLLFGVLKVESGYWLHD